MKVRFPGDDERDEYEALMRQAWGEDDGEAVVTADAAERMRLLLLDAEQAHRQWATAILDAALAKGLQSIGKQWLKSKSPVVVAFNGSVLGSTSARAGVTHRDPESGALITEQRLFDFMTWEQVLGNQRQLESQIRTLGIRRTAIKKLLDLRDRFPATTGPVEACEMLGMTVEDYLSAEDLAS